MRDEVIQTLSRKSGELKRQLAALGDGGWVSFNFHAARDYLTGLPRSDGTALLMATYPQKVRDWIAAQGGLTTKWIGAHAQTFLPKCEF